MNADTAEARRRRPNHVVERKLDELEACLADAMSSRPRRSDLDGSIFAEIQGRADFLRTLIAAEAECHGGARPEHLAEAEARLAVLEGAFDQWTRRDVVAAPAVEVGEQPEDAAVSGLCFGFDVTGGQEATFGATVSAFDVEGEPVATHKSGPEAAARRATQRSGWSRCAVCCGATSAVAVVALAVGVAMELSAVARQNVYIVPT